MARPWREAATQPRMIEVRCRDCGRLICKVDTERARVEAVCPDRRCKRYQTISLPARS